MQLFASNPPLYLIKFNYDKTNVYKYNNSICLATLYSLHAIINQMRKGAEIYV